jgi:glucokinase
MSSVLLGIDVGGSKVSGVAVDEARDSLLAERVAPLDGTSIDRQMLAMARTLLADAGGGNAAAVGLAVPGQVDVRRGVMRLAVNLEEGELAIGPIIEAAVGAPCFVEHDARAVALWLHQTRGGDLAYLSVGTGISAGIVVEGRLIRGSEGLAGEIGHLCAEPDGPECACGLAGCLEAVASGPAIARRAREAMRTGRSSSLPSEPTTEQVYRAASEGDELAREVVSRASLHLAHAVRGLVFAFGVPLVVIGGGVARAGDSFLQPILEALDRERLASPLLRQAIPPHTVQLLSRDRDAGAMGAIAVARIGLAGADAAAVRRREVVER